MSLIDAAAFLSEHYPVFPCLLNKRPATEHGFKDAVSDPTEARRLFRTAGAAMIGVPTGEASGLAVIDLDVKEGRFGLEWLAANEHRLPRTRRHRTQSGGLHLLFAYPAGRNIRNSASKISPGVDVRGNGGYIIAPPSPGYSIEDDTMPSPMPAWLVELLDPPKVERVAPTPGPRATIYTNDGTPYGLAALTRECEAIRNAGEGQKHATLNRGAYSIGGLVAAGEVIEGAAYAALSDALASIRHRCDDFPAAERTLQQGFRDGMASPRQPPPREVRHTIRIEVAEPEMIPWDRTPDGPGYDDQPYPDHTEAYDPETGEIKQQGAHLKEPPKSRFKTLSISEVLDLPPPEWLVEGVLTCGGYAGIYGPPASLKSFTVLGMALAVAYGQQWAGRPVKQMGVLYVAGEGARGTGKRIKAWQQHFGLSGTEAPFRLLSDGVNLTNPQDTADLILATLEAAALEGFQIGLVIIDTVARAMVGADENSATDMGRFNEACAEIIRGVDGAPCVLAVHHTGKDADRGPRGSNSFFGAGDTMLKVTREGNRLTLKVEKQKDDEDGFDIALKSEPVRSPGAPDDAKPYSLVVVDASADPAVVHAPKAPSVPPAAQLALSALISAIEAIGQHRKGLPNVPSTVPSVTENEWRQAYYSRSGAPTTEAKAVGFKRAIETLAAKGVALKVDGFAWIVRA